MDLVRAELDPDVQDILAPITRGGLMLHKIFGLMHDTCSTANCVADLMAVTRDEGGKDYYGADEWDGKSNKAKPMLESHQKPFGSSI